VNWWLRDLVKRFREEYGCPPADREKTDEDFEEPCRLCRLADSVIAQKWSPLDWATDGGVVAEVESGTYANVERAGDKWSWKVTQEQGWELVTTHEGTATSLVDALQAAERAVRGVD
jgi:hypothetical protein